MPCAKGRNAASTGCSRLPPAGGVALPAHRTNEVRDGCSSAGLCFLRQPVSIKPFRKRSLPVKGSKHAEVCTAGGLQFHTVLPGVQLLYADCIQVARGGDAIGYIVGYPCGFFLNLLAKRLFCFSCSSNSRMPKKSWFTRSVKAYMSTCCFPVPLPRRHASIVFWNVYPHHPRGSAALRASPGTGLSKQS